MQTLHLEVSAFSRTAIAKQQQLSIELWHMVFYNLFSGMQLWATGWDNGLPRIVFHRDFVDASRVKTLLSMLGVSRLHRSVDSWDYDHRRTTLSLGDPTIRDVLFEGSSTAILSFLVREACWYIFPWDPENEFDDTLLLETVYFTYLKHITMVLPSQLGPLGLRDPSESTETEVWEYGHELALDVMSHFFPSRTLKTLNILVTVPSDNVANPFHACIVSDVLYEIWRLMSDAGTPLLGGSYAETLALFALPRKSLHITARFVPNEAGLYRHEVRKGYRTISEEMSDIFLPVTWEDYQKSQVGMGYEMPEGGRVISEREEFGIALRRHWGFTVEESVRFKGRVAVGCRGWLIAREKKVGKRNDEGDEMGAEIDRENQICRSLLSRRDCLCRLAEADAYLYI